MIGAITMLAGLAIGIALGRLWAEHAAIQRALKPLRGPALPAATALASIAAILHVGEGSKRRGVRPARRMAP